MIIRTCVVMFRRQAAPMESAVVYGTHQAYGRSRGFGRCSGSARAASDKDFPPRPMPQPTTCSRHSSLSTADRH